MNSPAEIDLDALGGEFALAAAGVAGVSATTWLGTKAARVLPNRRLWRLAEPDKVVICVASSGEADTGRYFRPMTGIGQLRALALVMPSLSRAYPGLDVTRIQLSSVTAPPDIEHDLICLGGRKNNDVTRRCLEAIQLPFDLRDDEISWSSSEGEDVFRPELADGAVGADFGAIVQTANPFCRGKRVIILAGVHTFGTIAAARHFVTRHTNLSLRKPRDFASLVAAPVRDGYVYEPSELRLTYLDGT